MECEEGGVRVKCEEGGVRVECEEGDGVQECGGPTLMHTSI